MTEIIVRSEMNQLPYSELDSDKFAEQAKVIEVHDNFVRIQRYQYVEEKLVPAIITSLEMYFIHLDHSSAIRLGDTVRNAIARTYIPIRCLRIESEPKEIVVVTLEHDELVQHDIDIRELIRSEKSIPNHLADKITYGPKRLLNRKPKLFHKILDEHYNLIVINEANKALEVPES